MLLLSLLSNNNEEETVVVTGMVVNVFCCSSVPEGSTKLLTNVLLLKCREAFTKKAFISIPVATLMVLLANVPAASAKAPTVKLTVSGGGLTRTIELTDPQLVRESNVWGGEFLDFSRGPVKEPPPGLQRYEVSFYVRFAGDDTRKMYVLYYCPNSNKQGYIYLPGKGETWHRLNGSTITRSGQDGKWNYASPAWEKLLKSTLTRARSPQLEGS